MQMRNQPSKKTGKVDIIDRHIKGRCLIIDSRLLLIQNSMEISMLIMDIAEISDYYDVLVLAKKGEEDYIKGFLQHWDLAGKVVTEYTGYDQILEKYKILGVFTLAAQAEKMRRYYRSTIFAR